MVLELTMRCPNCNKESVKKYRPFCSDRCRKIDLGKWFAEDYRVKGEDVEEEIPTDTEESEVF